MDENNAALAKKRKLVTTVVISVVIAVALLVTLAVSAHKVEPSYQGLKISGGKLAQESLSPGFYFLIPFWQRVEDVFTGTVSTDEDKKGNFKEENPFRNIQPLSKDGQVIDIDVQLGYSVVDAIAFREK